MLFRAPAIVLAALLAQSALAVDCPAGSYWKPKPNKPSEYTCTQCSPGFISKAANVYACEPCPAGQEDFNNHKQCTNCQAGEFSPGGAACTTCPDGTYSINPGSSTCTSCAAGKENTSDHKGCKNCPAGEFSTGGSACQTCPNGTYSASEGSSTCTNCAAGKENTSDHKGCQNCPAGEFSTGGSACQTCPAGTYSNSVGSSTCTNCAAGKENTSDHKNCQNCPAGKFSTGGSACQTCPNGTYSTGPGSTTCSNCAAGQESRSDRQGCQKCDPGEFNPTAGQACQKCPAGKFNSVSGAKDCCDCCAGYYSSSPGSTSCSKCRDFSSSRKYGPVGASSSNQCSTNQALYGNYATSCGQTVNNACPATTPGGPQGSIIVRKKRDSQCTKGFTSCPRFSGRGGSDCVDTENDPESCGGCLSLDGEGSGTDCTAIQGISATRCVKGSCVIDSCRKGWVKSLDGSECVLASRATGSPASDGLHAQGAPKAKRSSAKRAIRHNIF